MITCNSITHINVHVSEYLYTATQSNGNRIAEAIDDPTDSHIRSQLLTVHSHR